jgi:hypothetical protein
MNRVPREEQDEVIDRLVPDSGRAGRELIDHRRTVDASRVLAHCSSLPPTDDKFIPAKTVGASRAPIRCSARVMPGHGHMIVLEPGWQEVAGIVADWFAAIPARPREPSCRAVTMFRAARTAPSSTSRNDRRAAARSRHRRQGLRASRALVSTTWLAEHPR